MSNEQAVTGFSRDGLHALDIAEELLEGGPDDDLRQWASECLRYYLAAGCDLKEFVERLPRLLYVLSDNLADVRKSCLETAEKPDPLQRDPEERRREQEEDRAKARAVEGLLERIRIANDWPVEMVK